MHKQIEGSRAVAEAIALCRPRVICAYPITPQTHIVEGLGEWAARLPPRHARCVPASELARQHVGRPLPNAALLGGFAALTGAVDLESVCAAIRERFPGAVGERNVAAASAAYDRTLEAAPRAVAAEAPC